MPAASPFEYFHYRAFATPTHERQIYPTIKKNRIRRIVEIGFGNGVRASRILRVAMRFASPRKVSYTGIDLFEASNLPNSISMKSAYQLLARIGVEARLIPGEPRIALSRCANELNNVDLLFISDLMAHGMESAWLFVPRILSSNAVVFQEHKGTNGQLGLSKVNVDDIRFRGKNAQPNRQRAA